MRSLSTRKRMRESSMTQRASTSKRVRPRYLLTPFSKAPLTFACSSYKRLIPFARKYRAAPRCNGPRPLEVGDHRVKMLGCRVHLMDTIYMVADGVSDSTHDVLIPCALMKRSIVRRSVLLQVSQNLYFHIPYGHPEGVRWSVRDGTADFVYFHASGWFLHNRSCTGRRSLMVQVHVCIAK